MNYHYYKSKSEWRFQIVSKGRIVAWGEGYKSKRGALVMLKHLIGIKKIIEGKYRK